MKNGLRRPGAALRKMIGMAQDAYLAVVVLINAYFLASVLSNIVYFRRATKRASIRNGPFVSVIVPARNEERSIAHCVESLLAQEYADYEVIVVDDESTDATAGIVAALAARHPRLKLISSGPLPDGWLGKTYALAQGVAASRGEILILTDADTVHEPASISWAVTNLQDHQADLLSGYLSQEYGSLGEGITVPVLYAMMMLIPFYLLPRTKNPQLAFSIGQYVVVRRAALDDVGGFETIKDVIVDDLSMAVRMKEFGYRVVFLDAKRAANCRMYAGFRDSFNGLRRTIYSAVGGHPLPVLAIAAIVLGLVVLPAASVLVSVVRLEMPTTPVAVAFALFTAQWALLAWDRETPAASIVLYPLVFLNLVVLLNASMWGTGFGLGVAWKGRLVHVPRSSGDAPQARTVEP